MVEQHGLPSQKSRTPLPLQDTMLARRSAEASSSRAAKRPAEDEGDRAPKRAAASDNLGSDITTKVEAMFDKLASSTSCGTLILRWPTPVMTMGARFVLQFTRAVALARLRGASVRVVIEVHECDLHSLRILLNVADDVVVLPGLDEPTFMRGLVPTDRGLDKALVDMLMQHPTAPSVVVGTIVDEDGTSVIKTFESLSDEDLVAAVLEEEEAVHESDGSGAESQSDTDTSSDEGSDSGSESGSSGSEDSGSDTEDD
jgi:hypothetical protein